MEKRKYLDIHGYEIPDNKKAVICGGYARTRGGEITARYVKCERINGLVSVFYCKECEHFAGFQPRHILCKCKQRYLDAKNV